MADFRRRLPVVPLVVIGLGLVTAILGLLSPMIWPTADVVIASAQPAAGEKYLVSDPGVLSLVSPDVTVRAIGNSNEQVTLAIGRQTDVAGWVAGNGYSRITGLSDWTTLATQTVAAGQQSNEATSTAENQSNATDAVSGVENIPIAESPVEADQSDMWVAQSTGTGSATLRWSNRPGSWVLLATGSGETAPAVEMTWPRAATTPLLWPLVGVGSGLALLGGLLALLLHRRAAAPVVSGVAPEVIPVEPEVTPVEAVLEPVEPEVAPVVAEPETSEPVVSEVAPDVVPDEPEVAPIAAVVVSAEPEATPVEAAEPETSAPMVSEVAPDVVPDEPEVAPIEVVVVPSEPEMAPVGPVLQADSAVPPVEEDAVGPVAVGTVAAPPAEPLTETAVIRLGSRRQERLATEALRVLQASEIGDQAAQRLAMASQAAAAPRTETVPSGDAALQSSVEPEPEPGTVAGAVKPPSDRELELGTSPGVEPELEPGTVVDAVLPPSGREIELGTFPGVEPELEPGTVADAVLPPSGREIELGTSPGAEPDLEPETVADAVLSPAGREIELGTSPGVEPELEPGTVADSVLPPSAVEPASVPAEFAAAQPAVPEPIGPSAPQRSPAPHPKPLSLVEKLAALPASLLGRTAKAPAAAPTSPSAPPPSAPTVIETPEAEPTAVVSAPPRVGDLELPVIDVAAATTAGIPVPGRRVLREAIREAQRTGNTEALQALTGAIPMRSTAWRESWGLPEPGAPDHSAADQAILPEKSDSAQEGQA